MTKRIWRGVLLVAALALPMAALCGQWTAGGGYPGVCGPHPSEVGTQVKYLAYLDADGAGPGAPELVVSGTFFYAGPLAAPSLVRFAPATGTWTWFGIYTGIYAIGPFAPLANGDLAVLDPGGLRRLTTSGFTSLAAGLNGPARAVVELANGDLVVGGSFTQAGGVPVANLARWNGTTWSALDSGVDGTVDALLVLPGDQIFAAGAFTTAGAVAAAHIAFWNGTSWSGLGSGTNDRISHLALHNGELIAAGTFTSAGGVPAASIARWNGLAWAPLGSGIAGSVGGLAVDAAGDLFVGGAFAQAGGVPAANIARWDGSAWSPLGAGRPAGVRALLALPGGDIYVGGDAPLAHWDGTRWRAVGPGIDATVRAAVIEPSGASVFGGDFTQAGTVDASHIARWSHSTWSPLGAGVDGTVRALATLPSGTLVAGGDFLQAGGAPANRIARWDGTTWSAMDTGANAPVRALAATAGDGVFAGGDFTVAGTVTANRVAFFDGSVWSPLGTGLNGPVLALAVLPDGSVVAGGTFTQAGGMNANRIARWDGTTWAPLGAGFNAPVAALAVLPNGDVVAGGSFTTADGAPARHLARWDGTAWSEMPVPLWTVPGYGPQGDGVTALTVLADGDLVATNFSFGFFVPGQPASNVVRWNGTSWSLFVTPNGWVYALAADTNGQLALGGGFTGLNGFGGPVAAFAARYRTARPAVAAPFGVGCASAGGSNTLVATALPWVDATFRATGTGLPDPAIVVAVSGWTSISQGVLPLASLFAEGHPGCDVLVQPDILQALIATGGTAESSLYLPSVPPLVGLHFYHQMISFEVDGNGAFVAITATNALHLTVGDV